MEQTVRRQIAPACSYGYMLALLAMLMFLMLYSAVRAYTSRLIFLCTTVARTWQGGIPWRAGCRRMQVSSAGEEELPSKSPYMFSKYLHGQQATLATRSSEGWLKTGNIAWHDGACHSAIGPTSLEASRSNRFFEERGGQLPTTIFDAVPKKILEPHVFLSGLMIVHTTNLLHILCS